MAKHFQNFIHTGRIPYPSIVLDDGVVLKGNTVPIPMAAFAAGQSNGAPAAPPVVVRKDFPESWIWENIDNDGFVKSLSNVLVRCS